MGYEDSMEKSMQIQGAVALAGLGLSFMGAKMSKDEYDRFLEVYGPLEKQIVGEVSKPTEQNAGYLSAVGDINQMYGNASANAARSMGGRYEYGSGLETAKQDSLERDRIRSISGTKAGYDQLRTQNMIAAASIGKGIPAYSISGVNQSASGVQNAAGQFGQQASIYGNLTAAEMQAQAMKDAAMWGAVGDVAGAGAEFATAKWA